MNPETNDTFLRDLAFNSVGIEWNVLNFIRYVVQNGELVNATRSGEFYYLTFQLNRTESTNAGTIDYPRLIVTKISSKLVPKVDLRGRPLGGFFEQKVYTNTSRGESTSWLTVNFTVLGKWTGPAH